MNKKCTPAGAILAVAATGMAQAGVVLNTDFSASEGYTSGNLRYQNGWEGGPQAQVDVTSTGSVSSMGGPYDRNVNLAGARGGLGGVPESTGDFEEYDELKFTTIYSFTLAGEGNTGIAQLGIRGDGPNAENGWAASPEQGVLINYNAYDPDPGTVDDGSVKFWPGLTDTGSNADAMVLEGLDVGINPGAGDFSSDPLKIEYTIRRDDVGDWSLVELRVTNETTTSSFVYGGNDVSFSWTSTDAFYSQLLASTGNASFSGTVDTVLFEYTPAPAVRGFLDVGYTSAEGYVAGNLAGQDSWIGQTATVDPTGSGTISAGPYLTSMYDEGLLGGTGGAPNEDGDFTAGESIRVILDYQVTLAAAGNTNLIAAGFRNEGPNSGNGFSTAPLQGFKVDYSGFDPVTGGALKVFPDLNDSANSEAMFVSGNDVGLDPANTADLVSDNLRFIYTLGIVGDGTWKVEGMVVVNLDTGASWCYEGPEQIITWSDTDAFFAQRLSRSNNGTAGSSDGVKIDFLALPDPDAVEPVVGIDYTWEECYSTGSLAGQNGWNGQTIAQVDASGTGAVSSAGGPYDRNVYSAGLRGGVAGVPNPTGDFGEGDVISLTMDYRFELSGNSNLDLMIAGVREDGDGAQAGPQQGFKINFNVFDPATGGGVKFFPDLTDPSSSNGDALIITGDELGVHPDGGQDLVSDRLRIHYVATHQGGGAWTVTSFQVENLDTGDTFEYTKTPQTFSWTATDAFFAQQLAINGDNGFTGTTDGVWANYLVGVPAEFKVTSVVATGGNLVIEFIGTPGASYKLTESSDLVQPFTDTGEVTTADPETGIGTFTYALSGPRNFVRVEDDLVVPE